MCVFFLFFSFFEPYKAKGNWRGLYTHLYIHKININNKSKTKQMMLSILLGLYLGKEH